MMKLIFAIIFVAIVFDITIAGQPEQASREIDAYRDNLRKRYEEATKSDDAGK